MLRVFIIFIIAIINDCCLCALVRVKIYTFDFYCLIVQQKETKKTDETEW